jgi:peptidoglycan/LPS O-acetylase OafA/YrhL
MRRPPASAQSIYLPSLDGLRAVSILLVVISHLGLGYIIPGGLGVTIFFFISGFIITRMLLLENARFAAISLPAFYVRRVFRLAPALAVYILLCLISFAALGKPIPVLDTLAAIFYAANYYNVFHGWGEGTAEPPLSILWSLAVEEHFYLGFPLLLVVMRKRLGALLIGLCSLIVTVLAWRIYLVIGLGLNDILPLRVYVSTDTRIDSIVFGCLVSVYAFWTDSLPDSSKHRTFERILASRTALLTGAALMLGTLLYRDEDFRQTWRYSLQGLAMVPLFYRLFVFGRTGLIDTALSSRPMVLVGQLSYSLYLHHWLALAFLSHLMRGHSLVQIDAVAVPLMALLALSSYYWIETPMRRRGHHIARRITTRAHQPSPSILTPSDGRTSNSVDKFDDAPARSHSSV